MNSISIQPYLKELGGGGGGGFTYLREIISVFIGNPHFCRKLQFYFGNYPEIGSTTAHQIKVFYFIGNK